MAAAISFSARTSPISTATAVLPDPMVPVTRTALTELASSTAASLPRSRKDANASGRARSTPLILRGGGSTWTSGSIGWGCRWTGWRARASSPESSSRVDRSGVPVGADARIVVGATTHGHLDLPRVRRRGMGAREHQAFAHPRAGDDSRLEAGSPLLRVPRALGVDVRTKNTSRSAIAVALAQ